MNLTTPIYDPTIGRFLSVDPLFEAFPNQSPYSYALNNPLSFKDPSGLAPEKEKGGKNQIQMLFVLQESEQFQQIEALQREWGGVTSEHDPSETSIYGIQEKAQSNGGNRLGLDVSVNGVSIKSKLNIYDIDGTNAKYEYGMQISDENGSFWFYETGCVDLENNVFFPESQGTRLDLAPGVNENEWLDGIQTGLDLVGFLPGIGDIAGIASAAIDLYRGNYLNAGLSLLSAIPVIGIVGDIAKGGKVFERTMNIGLKFNRDQAALINLAKDAKKIGGVNINDAKTLKEWSIEYKIQYRGPEVHPNKNFKDEHIHLGPVEHIKIKR